MEHDGGKIELARSTVVATWPKGSFAENLAIDAAGHIFVTLHTDKAVFRVDPVSGETRRFASFDTPVAGLAFGRDGALYVSGGTPGQVPGVVWRVDDKGVVSKAADLPDAMFLNGMTPHPDGRLLVIESILGRIYAVDPATGELSIWLADAQLAAVPGDFTPGANGVKLFGGFAYVSVTCRDRVLRTPVGADGAPGRLLVVAERLRADDFAIDQDGALFIATHLARSLLRLAPDGERTTLAGPEQGMVGSTAVAFGRTDADRHCVYVTTTGGTMTVPDQELEVAKLIRVDVGRVGYPLMPGA